MIRYLMLLAAALAAPAGAAPLEEMRRVSVPVDGIRLDRPEAIASLRVRIGRAASEVCEPGDRTLGELMRSLACAKAAKDRANAQLDALIARGRLAATAIRQSN